MPSSSAGLIGGEQVAVNAPVAAGTPEDEELIVALGDLGAGGENPRAAGGAGASPRTVSGLFDLMNVEANVELEGGKST